MFLLLQREALWEARRRETRFSATQLRFGSLLRGKDYRQGIGSSNEKYPVRYFSTGTSSPRPCKLWSVFQEIDVGDGCAAATLEAGESCGNRNRHERLAEPVLRRILCT